MLNKSKGRPILLMSVLVAALIGLAACGSDDPSVVVQTVIVEREVAGETVVQTVIVEKEIRVAGETVVQTVIVEKEVRVAGETVVQTVIVEREVQVAQAVIVAKELMPPGTIIPYGNLMVAI